MDLEEKRTSLHREALKILESIIEMEKSGASEEEIEARINEANKITEEAKSLNPKINALHRKRIFKAYALTAIMIFLFITAIALGFF